jgi:putative glutamine amidotransferase
VKQKIVIGITDCSKYKNYEAWISTEPGVEVIRLDHKSGLSEIGRCHGVLFTGGEDVHPRRYQKPEYLDYCEQDNMDEQRDELEWKAVAYTQQHNIPVLGICRGLQVINVFFGGSLVPDLPSFGKYDHSKFSEGKDRYHALSIDPNSAFHKIVGIATTSVNSSHHQAAGTIGHGLTPCAFSPDGVVEAIERRVSGKSFLLLVQWHPERMNDQESPVVKKIKKAFLESLSA